MRIMFEIEWQMFVPHATLLYLAEKAREFAATGENEACISIRKTDSNHQRCEVLCLGSGPRFVGDFHDETGELTAVLINRGRIIGCVDNDPED